MEQSGSLHVYNAYEPGLFCHDLTESQAIEHGLNLEAYLNGIREFRALCERLGNRVLGFIKNYDVSITPEPVDSNLLHTIAQTLGVRLDTTTFLDVGLGNSRDITESIVNHAPSMDVLRKLVQSGQINILNPRTYSLGSVTLAQQLGISHAHRVPAGSNIAIDGVYPSLNYLETHTSSFNNSKVRNYQLYKEIDRILGLDLSPEGDIAFDAKKVVEIVHMLSKSGKKIMIKADLSVDGMGNYHFDPRSKIDGIVPFIEMDFDAQIAYIKKELSNRNIPLGPFAGVVVTEFLSDKIHDPSLEIYCPPAHLGEPFVYYSCSMIIQKNSLGEEGFAGTITEDPYLHGQALDPNSPLAGRIEEYNSLMKDIERAFLTFARMKWREGYVGIMDCDVAVCIDPITDRMYAKILESNVNRETGGTAAYHLSKRMLNGHGGYVIARDSMQGSRFMTPFDEIYNILHESGVKYSYTDGGVMILSYNSEAGNIMPIVVGNTLADALKYDNLLSKLASD